MRRLLSAAGMALIVAAPMEARAKDPVFVTTKPVADKPSVMLDPKLGYIFLRADRPEAIHLMRMASAEDRIAYDKMRADALAKERKRYPAKMEDYRRSLATYEVLRKTNRSAKKPERPVEPSEENFVYPAFGLRAGASIGPMNRFAKGENGYSVYLQSITPGEYRVYGLMSVAPGAPVGGICFCMGSVKFTVRAGEIVDLGKLAVGGRLVPSASGMEADSRLKSWKLRPADYRAVGKLPNYFGVTLGRIQPMAGVVAFDRDRIIDLAAPPAANGLEPSRADTSRPAS